MSAHDVLSGLRPLDQVPVQALMFNRLQLINIVEHVLKEIGKADVWVSTFSTSEEFLRGMWRLKGLGLVGRSVLLADLKAAKKTVLLKDFMRNVFDDVFLTENHSKVVLFQNGTCVVSVITSQNQTRGNRTEAACITSDEGVFYGLRTAFEEICETRSIRILDYDTRTD